MRTASESIRSGGSHTAEAADPFRLFHSGESLRSYRWFGAHLTQQDGVAGVRFAVWAPRARQVGVAGPFNGWDGSRHPLQRIEGTGVWTGFVGGIGEGELYKYEIVTPDGRKLLKADPYAFCSERRPGTASVVASLAGFPWRDGNWLKRRRAVQNEARPLFIYEVHAGSWKRADDGSFLSYEQLAEQLPDYAAELGFTHIELLPLAEHPFDGSWGYQQTGYYSPTSRYGSPRQLMAFVNRCHERGIGVILDWVPGHFCKDEHGLRQFDGLPLYEYEDERKAEKPQWGTLSFDFSRPEVASFLLSNALFWFDVYHIDGLRVDAVASMIDYNLEKPPHLFVFDEAGKSDNAEAIAFLTKLNEVVRREYPGVLMIAEDSSARPLSTLPPERGGLGFHFKWNMGWMNDILRYAATPPEERPRCHRLLNFSRIYAYDEKFVLPLSHDEVVHLKKSLLGKMPGDRWCQFAALRVLYLYMLVHPGKKLLFMGGELAQPDEWSEARALDWRLLDEPLHRRFHRFVREANRLYNRERALWELDHDPAGFDWIDPDDADRCVVSLIRRGRRPADELIAVLNFSDRDYVDFRLGVPAGGTYQVVFSSDLPEYGGTGRGSGGRLAAEPQKCHNRPHSVALHLPAYSAVLLKRTEKACPAPSANGYPAAPQDFAKGSAPPVGGKPSARERTVYGNGGLQRMKVLFAASEAAPFVKSGGLADVVGALPKELVRLGADVRVMLPLYGTVPDWARSAMSRVAEVPCELGWRRPYCGVHRLEADGVVFYFIDNEYYFRRDGLYGYDDDAERFIFFSRAVLAALPHIGFAPDVIHCHDWQTGLIPFGLAAHYVRHPFYARTRSVFTIHNLKYQGRAGRELFQDLAGAGDEYMTPDGLEYYGDGCCLKGGIVYADRVTTVSETYAAEIRTPYFGEGMDGVIAGRGEDVVGIVNGIDNELYDPLNDPHLAANFSRTARSLERKRKNKPALQRELGLPENEFLPLVVIVSRLVEQKGFDLVAHVLDELLQMDLQLAVLGAGDAVYEQLFAGAAARYPEKCAVRIGFDEPLARRMYAAADLFLMPSRFEPCGLGQLIAMRYLAVPVVRETGGLKDTVRPYNEFTGEGTGIGFANYNAHEMLDAVRKGLRLYADRAAWERLVGNIADTDFGWARSAAAYYELYRQLAAASG